MISDFEEVLKVFNASGVKYLIVGGYAVMRGLLLSNWDASCARRYPHVG